MLCVHSLPSPLRSSDRGFTLVELMVVVVIMGIMAAISVPLVNKDSRNERARSFAMDLARDFQVARSRAVAERLPQRAYIFSNRIAWRSWVGSAAGSEVAGAPVAGTAGATPPSVNDPPDRVLFAPEGVVIWGGVSGTPATGPTVPDTGMTDSTPCIIDIDVIARTWFRGTSGGTPTAPTGATIYMVNTLTNFNDSNADRRHPYARTAVRAFGLTSQSKVIEGWR